MLKRILRCVMMVGMCISFLDMGVVGISADSSSNDVYYTNMNGIGFTKEEFQNINRYFGKDTIAAMDEKMASSLKKNCNLTLIDSDIIYVETVEQKDSKGNIISEEERIVDRSRASSLSRFRMKSEHITSMKKITLIGYKKGASENYINITNEWIKLPEKRSYDVIALRPASTSVRLQSITATQTWDDNIIEYSPTGNKVKNTSTGIGVSMNLKNDAKNKITNTLLVYFVSGKDPFKVYGTYQHATAGISLENSKKYSISSKGYGKVLLFKDSVRDKYDNTAGLNVTCSLSEIQ